MLQKVLQICRAETRKLLKSKENCPYLTSKGSKIKRYYHSEKALKSQRFIRFNRYTRYEFATQLLQICCKF